MVFVAFCTLSSAVYILNDLRDAPEDRLHPIKKDRPIASGKVSALMAYIVLTVLLLVTVLISIWLGNIFEAGVFALYFVINMFYSLGGKNIPLIDVFIIAAGFILRVFAGAIILNIPVSKWLWLTVLFGSLFLAFGKRRGEVLRMINEGNTSTRKVLEAYNKEFLDGAIWMCLGLFIAFYSLWATDTAQFLRGQVYTIPLVAFILLKYRLILDGDEEHGDPVDVLMKSASIIVAVFLLIGMLVLGIYLK
jgi:4-hydroxybenzoate polyprenyltransferase